MKTEKEEISPIPIQIRLNSERAIKNIIKDDPELEISIKNAIAENIAKSYIEILTLKDNYNKNIYHICADNNNIYLMYYFLLNSNSVVPISKQASLNVLIRSVTQTGALIIFSD